MYFQKRRRGPKDNENNDERQPYLLTNNGQAGTMAAATEPPRFNFMAAARDAFQQPRQLQSTQDSSDSDLPSLDGTSASVSDNGTNVELIDVLGGASGSGPTSTKSRKAIGSKVARKRKPPKKKDCSSDSSASNSPKKRRPQWRNDAVRALVHVASAKKNIIKGKFEGATGTRIRKRVAWQEVAGNLFLTEIKNLLGCSIIQMD